MNYSIKKLFILEKDYKVYHGSKVNFSKFDVDKMKELGFHFGSKEQAKHRSNNGFVKCYNVSINNPLKLNDPFRWDVKNTLQQMQTANYISKEDADNLEKEIMSLAIVNSKKHGTGLQNASIKILISKLEQMGFDGVLYKNQGEGGGDAIIAFNPEQIKEI